LDPARADLGKKPSFWLDFAKDTSQTRQICALVNPDVYGGLLLADPSDGRMRTQLTARNIEDALEETAVFDLCQLPAARQHQQEITAMDISDIVAGQNTSTNGHLKRTCKRCGDPWPKGHPQTHCKDGAPRGM
jgi:hypothetical protein